MKKYFLSWQCFYRETNPLSWLHFGWVLSFKFSFQVWFCSFQFVICTSWILNSIQYWHITRFCHIIYCYRWVTSVALSNNIQVNGSPSVSVVYQLLGCHSVTVCWKAWIDPVLMKRNTWEEQSLWSLPHQLKQLWSTACQEKVKKGKQAL